MDELIEYDAIALGELTRRGEISPIELLDITIKRIEEFNPKLNAVIHKMYDQARETARNWSSEISADKANDAVFCGVPFLLKDLIAECKGTPFVEGSKAVKGYISKLDTELVRRQKSSGLVIAGKTNTPEFGAMPTTEPALYGPTMPIRLAQACLIPRDSHVPALLPKSPCRSAPPLGRQSSARCRKPP